MTKWMRRNHNFILNIANFVLKENTAKIFFSIEIFNIFSEEKDVNHFVLQWYTYSSFVHQTLFMLANEWTKLGCHQELLQLHEEKSFYMKKNF